MLVQCCCTSQQRAEAEALVLYAKGRGILLYGHQTKVNNLGAEICCYSVVHTHMLVQCCTSQQRAEAKALVLYVICWYSVVDTHMLVFNRGQKQMLSFTDTEIAVSACWICATSNEHKQQCVFVFVYVLVLVFV